MVESIFALPVSVEQVAAVIKQMGQAEQRHLLELVPNFRVLASQTSSRTKEEAQERVAQTFTLCRFICPIQIRRAQPKFPGLYQGNRACNAESTKGF
ncbi:MAG: hypothetical protein GY801_45315 [bacterium]|nr:hypothetical protein [bacterium]